MSERGHHIYVWLSSDFKFLLKPIIKPKIYVMETFLTVINSRKQYYKTNSDSASDIFMSSQDSKFI